MTARLRDFATSELKAPGHISVSSSIAMRTISQLVPLLRQVSPRLSENFFTCRASSARPSFLRCLPRTRSAPFFQAFRFQSTFAGRPHLAGPIAGNLHSVSKTKSFPKTSDRVVAYWLLGSAASVFGIVIFGGLTRLTESGLSITEWRPVTGSLPPFNQSDWDSEFAKYRASPEFIRLNPRMTLGEFKQIYWMEWTHRLWGRVIGITVLVPTIYFIARRRVASHMAFKLVGICGLIGFQGFLGWWMVKSGLKDDLFAPGSHPRVSQYRLAAHLGTAFIAYSAMLLSGLSILRERALLANTTSAVSLLDTLALPHMRRFRLAVTALTALVFTTVMSGAFVAGLDAGLIYNEFPYMGLGLAPPKAELFDPRYSRDPGHSDLWWRNMLENPSLVQLDHRILATTTFTAVVLLFLTPRFSSKLKTAMPKEVKKGVLGVMHLASLQVILGISTLIYMVPTWLAAGHQAGALALLTGVLVLGSKLRVSPRTARMVRDLARQPHTTQARAAELKNQAGSVQQIVR